MSEVQGTDSTEDYHRGNPPWSEMKRGIPLKTWSGNVVYKRKKHTWHVKDYARVGKYVELDVDDSDPDFLRLILQYYRDATLEVLGKIIPVVSGDKIEELYDLVFNMVAKLFNVDTSYLATPPPSAERILYFIAQKFGFEVKKKL